MSKTVETRFSKINKADPVQEDIFISYFTDPLCAWSWAFETEWQKLKTIFGDRLHVTYHMGGLIPDWRTFSDSVNAVTRPLQMGPVWMHIAELTNVKLNHIIWMRDPPSSSYPSCIAFKCAEHQSRQAAELYLGLLREAAMLFGQNISKTDILMSLAANPVLELVGFNKMKFKKDLFNGKGLESFRRDLALTQTKRITRFPALVIRRKNKSSLLVSGYKKADEILNIIQS
jgi:predicted DsbA family dithiol-disulfide isomerase